ncbi:MAG: 50S ribosomal protein L35ae [Candidatus Bathyarchaeia archaeon]
MSKRICGDGRLTQQTTGIIVNYRVGPKSQRSKECIIQFSHVKSFSEACRLVGRKVAWKCGENRIVGKVVALHGKKGLVRARFRRGLPGQALGTTVELVG